MAKNPAEESRMRINDKIDQTLIDSRRIFLSDAVDNDSATDIIRKLWYLETIDPGKPILLLIHSPGGSVDAGFAIWDQIQMITSPITTLITGLAASFGSILSLAAGKGRRFATVNSRIMIHQPHVGSVIKGQATDLEIHAREIMKTRKVLSEIYVEATGRPYDKIENAIDRDTWFSASEAIDFGLLDGIANSYDDLRKKKLIV